MGNIQFNYLYRDGANYKNHGSVVFENDINIPLEEIESLIMCRLIDRTWFYVDQWLVPDLHFEKWDNRIDHTFHEFESIEFTENQTTTKTPMSTFLEIISRTNIYGFCS